MAVGDAPVHWSDTQNIKWKAEIPGRGHSSPVIWGDKIFVTTAIKTGTSTTPEPTPAKPAPGAKPPLVTSGPQVEHKFDVLCLDRKTGKILWQRTATTAVPHEGYHGQYGSFASNSPVTDGKHEATVCDPPSARSRASAGSAPLVSAASSVSGRTPSARRMTTDTRSFGMGVWVL